MPDVAKYWGLKEGRSGETSKKYTLFLIFSYPLSLMLAFQSRDPKIILKLLDIR